MVMVTALFLAFLSSSTVVVLPTRLLMKTAKYDSNELPVLAGDEARDVDLAVTERLGRVRVLESVATRIADTIAHHLGLENNNATPLLFVAGKGNNGANAMAAARILYFRGWKNIRLVPLVRPDDDNLRPNIKEQFELFHELVGKEKVHPLNFDLIRSFEDGVLIDGILGTGISSPPRGASLEAIQACNSATTSGANKPRILAIDIPSGMNHVTGEAPGGEAIQARWTINLHMLKTGQLTSAATPWVGELWSAETALGFHTFGPALQDKFASFYSQGPIRKVPTLL